MSIIFIDGLDRTGKSTVAKALEARGYKYIHMKAPDKKFYQPGYTGPSYLDSLVEELISFSGQDVVFDRTPYGEMVWPYVYGRQPLLEDEDYDILREIESQNDVKLILLHDPDVDAHWQRCVENNEKLSRSQFNSARQLFYSVAEKYNFKVLTMQQALEAISGELSETREKPQDTAVDHKLPERQTRVVDLHVSPSVAKAKVEESLTPEQRTLMQANAINEVLTGRVVRKRGEFFDTLEQKVREFLNQELATLLGLNKKQEQPIQQTPTPSFSPEEVMFIKTLIRNANAKRVQR